MATRKTTTKKTTAAKASTTIVDNAKEVAAEITNAAAESTAKVADVVEETKKSAAKKATAAKKTVEKTAAAAKETVEKKATAAKKTVKKAVKKDPVVTATVEFYGRSVLVSDIAAKAADAYKAAHEGAEIETLNLYIKPEENAAYYVVNGEASADFKVEL